MKLIDENYIIEEINARQPMLNGKIKVTSEEWDLLWDKYLGSTKEEVKHKSNDIHDWFNKVRQFGNKYERKN